MGIGISRKVADVTYNRFFMDSDSKAIAKRFKISYQLSIAAGILFSGLLKQYVLNRSFSAWKNFNAANALLSFLFSVLAVCRLFISLSNSNPNPNIQETIELNGISPSLDNNETNSNLDSDPNAGFGKIFENLILFVCLYMFQQFSSISGYFSYTEEIFADSPNIYIVLGVANFVGTLLNVAIEALKDSEDACNNCLGNLVNHFDIKSIILISGVVCLILFLVFFPGFLENIALIKSATAFCFIFCFSFGFGPSPWMITPEILPKSLQNAYNPFGYTLNWLCAFLVTFTTTKILSSLNVFAFLISSVFFAVFTLIMAFSGLGLYEKLAKFFCNTQFFRIFCCCKKNYNVNSTF
ncbi:hypothetical protein DI09_68p200 [Mitosporidium daphniae]|uniref:Major facilitator superfamily (MFS) profile domain-containing protein n=1 Tax=Mitosporidium daphniae TaxID=1485682 RepID=A0A098VN56_9MICR|nr:uncharacterized protein DI09_68p200 [Mitosporidium daphniae]KGG50512.1 hypothetical protein DI09_68p200 [Mitosporidium daphniae]|eukprot:XP_013236939.1 uncharacterized protein DI09_68p200 [Mitosporidium daphniae]